MYSSIITERQSFFSSLDDLDHAHVLHDIRPCFFGCMLFPRLLSDQIDLTEKNDILISALEC